MYSQEERLRFNLALSRVVYLFPELSKLKISIRFINGNQCMMAQPTYSTLFLSKEKRAYVIFITYKEPFITFIRAMPESILRGWFAHELSHIVSYRNMSSFGLLLFGLRYSLDRKFRFFVEQETNMFCYERGFAEEIRKGYKMVQDSEGLPQWYKENLVSL